MNIYCCVVIGNILVELVTGVSHSSTCSC